MEWELLKENVQPLKEGRNVEKLNASLKAQMNGSKDTMVLEEHRKMVEAIDEYQGDDPLHPWIECIHWVKEAYPSGGSQSRLLQLLELCARTFCKDQRYAHDLRYLKVWMDYADRCTNPREIYSFLQNNDIGQEHALFYEHYARFLEQQHKFSEAKAIYELGIARRAQPVDSLKVAYTRCMQRALRESTGKDEVPSPSSQGLSVRSFGNQLAGAKHGQPFQAIRKINGSKANRNPSQSFSVFVDTDLRPKPSTHRATGSMFTSESEINKENLQQPSRWTAVRVPQASSASSDILVELDVFKDEDCTHDSISTKNGALMSRGPTSRSLRLDDINGSEREEDKLKQNPLAYFEDPLDLLDLI